MRIALLTGANPKRSRGGPMVRLLAGVWRIEMENVTDTILRLHLDDDPPVVVKDTAIHTDKGAIARISFEQRGHEEHISVYAVKVA